MGHVDGEVLNPDKYACTVGSKPASGTIAQCFQGTLLNPSANGDSGSRGAAFLAGGLGTNQQNWLYVAGIGDTLNGYRMANTGLFGTTATSSTNNFGYPGASPTVTWNSSNSSNINDAIAWALNTSGYGKIGQQATAAVLYGYQAVPSGGSLSKLWDTSAYNTSAPGNPGAVKFVVPTIVEGKIFLAGGAQGYKPGSGTCSTIPTACGAVAMYK
jgi:hypothetical protein